MGFHMKPVPSILVFCDLDDTLFEPHAFFMDSTAQRALASIEREQVPLVFSSSKTRAELELIQQDTRPRIVASNMASTDADGASGSTPDETRNQCRLVD